MLGGVDVGPLAFLPPCLASFDERRKRGDGFVGVLELCGEADAHGVVAFGVETEHAVGLGED